jgi:hypothetical protein
VRKVEPSYLDWLRLEHEKLDALIADSPFKRGTNPDPKWLDKHELLISFKLSAEVAAYLAGWSKRIGVCIPGTVTFEADELHSTIAVITVPEALRDNLTPEDLAGLTAGSVFESIVFECENGGGRLITGYDRLIATSSAVVAWPATDGVLYPLRTRILANLAQSFTSDPLLEQIKVRGSWAEHVTIARFGKAYEPISGHIGLLGNVLSEWSATPRFLMHSVEISELQVIGGRFSLIPLFRYRLPD